MDYTTIFKAGRLALAAGCATVALTGLNGCGQSEASLLNSARSYLEKEDRNAAVIQLKTVLQKNPQLGEARLLMGRALLESGDAAGALIELEKAQERNVAQAEVAPLMARALMLQGQADKVLERYAQTTLDQPKAAAALKATVAAAHLGKGQRDSAKQMVEDALKLDANSPPARILQAQLAAAEGRLDEAAALAQAMIQQSINPHEAHTLAGSVALAKDSSTQSMADATKSFEAALAAKADYIPAHMALVSLASQATDAPAEVRKRWEALHKAAPRHPLSMLMEADYALRENKLERAQELSVQLLKGLPSDARVQYLAARVAERSGNVVQAEAHASRAIQIAPNWAEPRRMLAQGQVRNGQTKRALETLQPLIEGDKSDPETLLLAGQTLLQDGQAGKAEVLLRRAAALKPDDMRVKTLSAISQIGRGNDGMVLTELESIASQDSGTAADYALLSLRMRNQELDAAFKTVNSIKRKQPENPQPLQIEAQIHLLKKDPESARKSLEQALALKADYMPAVGLLAQMDVAAGKEDAARERFERVLKINPKNATAHLALVELQARKGANAGDIRKQLEAAVKAAPDAPALRLALINHLLGDAQDKRAALAAAQDANAAITDQPELVDALGRTQLANGSKEQAGGTFKRLAALQPQNLDFQVRLAESQSAMADVEEAVRTLRKALEMKNDHLPAQQALVANLVMLKRAQDATGVARSVQRQRPQEPVGWMMEGDVAANTGRLDEALAAYRTAMGKSRNTGTVMKLHAALLETGRQAEATELAASWERAAPTDGTFLGYMVDQGIRRKAWPEVEARLRNMLKAQPDNVVFLNNLAYALTMQRKPGALELAERANKLRPSVPTLMDTLALALAAEKQYGKAIEVQRQAVSQAADDPALKLNLARIYLDSGDKTSARKELQALSAEGKRFAQQDEVERLLKSL